MRSSFILSLLLVLNPLYFYGWGEDGHKIIAKITEANLKTKVKNKVQSYLGASSFEQASVWMDSIRADRSFDYMKPWHYVNVGRDSIYVKHPNGDIVQELELVISELRNYKNMKTEDVTKDLKILFHLCGDISQPLHAGYGIDRGGNDILVSFNGKNLKLHRVWDTDIIVNEKISMESCTLASKKWTGKQTRSFKVIDVMSWMNDSRSYLPSVYKIEENTINEKYLAENKVIIEAQLAKSGIRLAAVLNEIFKK